MLPTSMKPRYTSAAQPGSHGRGVWTQQLPPTGVSEMDGKGQGGRQAEGRGLPLLFGKALRPALEADLGAHGSGKGPTRGAG